MKRATGLGFAATLAWGLLSAGTLQAQDDALARVEELTSDSRVALAREELTAWFESAWDGASREDRQRALWLRGRLTVDGGMAERDYRRLVVEYPGGPFSDDALLRLGQLAWARSDSEAALRHLRILVRDYPESEHRSDALELTALLTAGTPSAGPGASGAVPTGPSAAQAGAIPASSPPTSPQATVTPGGLPNAVPSGPPGAVPSGPPSAPVTGTPGVGATSNGDPGSTVVPERFDGMPFTIELGAFSTAPPAQTIAAAAIAAGVEVRIVGLPGSDLIHVRTGAFFSQMEAQARALALRLQGLPAAVAPDREEEQPR